MYNLNKEDYFHNVQIELAKPCHAGDTHAT